ncbi:YjcQ family protein [Fusobacterium pseudoperiodonticum]|uniref:YjcQ family protein n=1 Tax=Fusobacterium pseudoperiodonticum TaxID=2663009 RepID=UPI0028E528EA|nr:YjcQ family protein [Fusobacterium pseudoperiodonticum]
MSYSTVIFQILKAIETLDNSVDFNLFEVFDISKINISEKLLIKILKNLIEEGYIKNFQITISGNNIFTSNYPELTLKGMLFLEENSSMKKAYKTLKEIKGWIPGFN